MMMPIYIPLPIKMKSMGVFAVSAFAHDLKIASTSIFSLNNFCNMIIIDLLVLVLY